MHQGHTHTHMEMKQKWEEEGGRCLLVACSLVSFPHAHVWPSLRNTTPNPYCPPPSTLSSIPFSSAQWEGTEGSACQPPDPKSPFPGPRVLRVWSAAECHFYK